jgi:hypothetical protein
MSSIACLYKMTRARFAELTSTDVDLGEELLDYSWSGNSMLDIVFHLEEIELLETSSWPAAEESDVTAFVFEASHAKKYLPKLKKYQPANEELMEACLSDYDESDIANLLASYKAAIAVLIEALNAIDANSVVVLRIG